MDTIRLRHAFLWICPACKLQNEVLITRREMTEEMLRQAYGIAEWESIPEDVSGDVMEIPVTVNCKCGNLYEVMPPEEWPK